MANSNLLKGAIKAKGLSQRELAKRICLSENTLSRKINNKGEFKSKEIEQIARILEISDILKYFL
jgi:transcriptional regulator with XRE-family HTH domain